MSRGRVKGAGRLWNRDGVWVLDFRDLDGVRHQRSLGRDKRKAELLRAEIIANRNRQALGLDRVPEEVQLASLTEDYLADLTTRVSPRHVRNVRCQLGLWLAMLPVATVGELKAVHLLRYRAAMLRDGSAPRTVNSHTQALMGALRWAVKAGLIHENPVPSIDKLPDGERHQRCQRRAMTDKDIEGFMEVVAGEDEGIGDHFVRVPQLPMWMTLLRTGMRYGEMRQVTWSDLDEARAVIRLRNSTTKSGKERTVPIGQDLLRTIVTLKAHQWRVTGRKATLMDPVFLSPRGDAWGIYSTNINRSLRRLLEKAGIPRFNEHGKKIDVHALRHTFASCLARNNVEISKTQRLLGHSTPMLTAKHYIHLDTEELRDAIDVLEKPKKPAIRKHA